MFVKIVTLDERTEQMYRCKKYVLSYFDDGPHIRIDDKDPWIHVGDCAVYVMNDAGKTIDTFKYRKK